MAKAAGFPARDIFVGGASPTKANLVVRYHGTGRRRPLLLLAHTDPEAVWFEMDVGWVAAAGVDPISLLRAHRQRFRLMHVKDIEASTVPNNAFHMDPADVGSGTLDWKTILPVGYEAGVRHYYVEQEPPFAGPRMDAARADYEYLARLV